MGSIRHRSAQNARRPAMNAGNAVG